MKKNPFRGLILFFVILLIATVAFAQSDELIKGTWHLSGTLPKTKNGGTFSWFLEWTFADGNFLQTGYPPLSQKGKYRILNTDGDKLSVQLYEQSGNFGTKDKQIEILVDKKNDLLKIDGKEGFKRVRKKEQSATALSPLTDEEYKVFLTILGNDRADFVVQDNIEGYEIKENGNSFIKKLFDELTFDTVEDFVKRNKESVQIEKKFPTKNNYTLITKDELKKFFDKGLNWDGFYKKYPKSGGLYSFSRVGFSKDGKQAIVNVSYSCGGLCGEGNYYLLKKENSEWKIIKKQMTWIS